MACALTQKEIDKEGLKDVVHRRKHKKGSRPGLTSKAIMGGPSTRHKQSPWHPPAREPTKKEKMKMLGCLLAHATQLVMQNHFYSFDNVMRKQSKCRAIGNKMTEILGEILMKRHSKVYLRKLDELGLTNELFESYVDDTIDALVAVDPGVKFDGEKLVKDEDKVEEDRGKFLKTREPWKY